MSPLALLLALSMGIGFLVQACDLTGFSISDVSHTITITNTSTDEIADTAVVLADGSTYVALPPGESRSAETILGTYSVSVIPTANRDSEIGYLRQIRAKLEEAVLDPSVSPVTTVALLTELDQINEGLKGEAQAPDAPACKGTIKASAKVTTVTLHWTQASGSMGAWTLHCG